MTPLDERLRSSIPMGYEGAPVWPRDAGRPRATSGPFVAHSGPALDPLTTVVGRARG